MLQDYDVVLEAVKRQIGMKHLDDILERCWQGLVSEYPMQRHEVQIERTYMRELDEDTGTYPLVSYGLSMWTDGVEL